MQEVVRHWDNLLSFYTYVEDNLSEQLENLWMNLTQSFRWTIYFSWQGFCWRYYSTKNEIANICQVFQYSANCLVHCIKVRQQVALLLVNRIFSKSSKHIQNKEALTMFWLESWWIGRRPWERERWRGRPDLNLMERNQCWHGLLQWFPVTHRMWFRLEVADWIAGRRRRIVGVFSLIMNI